MATAALDPSTRFAQTITSFAESNDIPMLHLNTPDRSRWNDHKVDHVHHLIDNATSPGVVAIVVAQEVQRSVGGTAEGASPEAFPKDVLGNALSDPCDEFNRATIESAPHLETTPVRR